MTQIAFNAARVRVFVVTCIAAMVFGVGLGALVPKAAASFPQTFDANTLIDNDSFLAIDSMSVADIQQFLAGKGGALANFSENGRSAAEIIWGAAHGSGDAAGSINEISITAQTGTVSPRVLLVTLQKEQSLITNPSPSQTALDYAMGYGCPDGSGCNAIYKGFTKQVEWAAWQFRYNYEAGAKDDAWRDRYYGSGSSFLYRPGYPGLTVTLTNTTGAPYNPPASQSVTIGNQATAALYRYTPHVYNGNYNFWNFFRQWFVRWSAQIVGRNGNQKIAQGGSAMLVVQMKNTGEETWQKSVVHLGTDRARDRVSAFIREDRQGMNPSGWSADNRIDLLDGPIAPGQIGTFRFYYTAPTTLPTGTYREYFNPVADGYDWFPNLDLSWDFTVVPPAEGLSADLVSRSNNLRLAGGQSGQFSVQLRNTGSLAWRRGTFNLGTDIPRDRVPMFIREDRVNGNPSGWVAGNRVTLVEDRVAPGQVGTFQFWYTIPDYVPAGTYREYFRPVYEQLAWLPDPLFDLSWDVVVAPFSETFHAQPVSQNSYPALTTGQSYQFEIKLKNMGGQTWTRDTVRLGTDRPRDRVPIFTRADVPGGNPSGWLAENRVGLVEESVPPGGIGTFRFWYTVPTGVAPGVYHEYFRPVAEHVTWMDDWGIYWDVTVR